MLSTAQERKAQVRGMFNLLAADYDATGPGFFTHFGRRLVEEVGIESGQRVLDVASGRGAILFPSAERVGASGEVVGIDLAEEMVQATNDEAVRRGVSTRLQVMDAEHLEFSDASFDRVVCGFGVMFFPHLDTALAEFRRVLRPGGRVGVSTWQKTQVDDLSVVFEQLGLAGPGEPGWITDPNFLAQALERAGFNAVHARPDTATFRFDDLEQYWQAARGTGLRRRLETLDADQTSRVREALAQRLKPFQREDGIYLQATALLGIGVR